MVEVHKMTERPIGAPVMRSLAKPSGAAHQAGHGSDRNNRHAISARKPNSGYQPLVDTIGNAELLNDGPRLAEAPISDPAVLRERLLERERRILGIHKEYLPVPEAADPPDTRFPSLASGYHLYADADGAREALAASATEIALRMIEAIPVPTPTLGEITPPLRLGEETRALTGRVRFDDGLEVEVTTLRWRRGSVELYADVAAAAGADLGELLVRLAQQHDAVYAANPLPAR